MSPPIISQAAHACSSSLAASCWLQCATVATNECCFATMKCLTCSAHVGYATSVQCTSEHVGGVRLRRRRMATVSLISSWAVQCSASCSEFCDCCSTVAEMYVACTLESTVLQSQCSRTCVTVESCRVVPRDQALKKRELSIRCQRARPDPVTYISTTNHAANSLATRLLSRDWLDTNRDGVVMFTIAQHFQTKWN